MYRSIYLILFLIPIYSVNGFAEDFPEVLKGTWKLENKNTFEHWDKLNSKSYKGFVYEKNNSKIEVQEYLDLYKKEDKWVYTATVINQNHGKPIDFILVQSDSLYSFENQDHDFPKFIRYKIVTSNKIEITIGDEKKQYSMIYQKTE